MSRTVTVAAAQMGAIARADSRKVVVDRMVALLHQAVERRADFVVYPELALTTFFPRWHITSDEELVAFYETRMPSPETVPLFEAAARAQIAFAFGYAEIDGDTHQRFNTFVIVDRDGRIALKYRKVHLPGHAEPEPWRAFQHLEKRYFSVGNLGFPVTRMLGGTIGAMICNDRRWPESYRMLGLKGAELIVLGYNTPRHNPPAPDHDRLSEFHNQLVMQSGAYQNGTFVVGVAKAGFEEGCELIGNSSIIAPTGELIAQTISQSDEVVVATCDLDTTKSYKTTVFDFARHRQPQHYGALVEPHPAPATTTVPSGTPRL